jgi:adenosylmethionine-8-amino-7-oxononanoate aminotransferase
MKDHAEFPPLFIQSAKGSYLTLQDGSKAIDGISSWWCKSLGHGHPVIKAAIAEQLEAFEHVMFGNTTYEKIILLSEKLSRLSSELTRVMYASDGSSAVEIALKMSLHSRRIRGEGHRQAFLCLENSYHGETALTMSVTDLGDYRDPYKPILTKTFVLKGIPYVSGKEDPLWENCDAYWPHLEAQLMAHQEELTAVIVEPIIQGAAGMKIYSKDFLKRLRDWTRKHGIHLIADEIMTGFGRTGLPLACDHAEVNPDFLCLGKGLTAGFLPLSAVITSDSIYELFYDDYEQGKSFLHSHTHTGNALAVSAALAMFEVMEHQKIYEGLNQLEEMLRSAFYAVAERSNRLKNLRHLGGVVAGDLIHSKNENRPGFEFYKRALKKGALLRPIGSTVYWLTPLNIEHGVITELQRITTEALL